MGDEKVIGDQPGKVHGESVSALCSRDGPAPLADAL